MLPCRKCSVNLCHSGQFFCATIRRMKTPKPPTSSKTVRLPDPSWPKLRELMQHHGRAWLVKLIDREHAKIQRQEVPHG